MNDPITPLMHHCLTTLIVVLASIFVALPSAGGRTFRYQAQHHPLPRGRHGMDGLAAVWLEILRHAQYAAARRSGNAIHQRLCDAGVLADPGLDPHGATRFTPRDHRRPAVIASRRRKGTPFFPTRRGPSEPIIFPESRNCLEPSHYTLAEALRDAAYRTGHFGKWHLGLTASYWPDKQGFDVTFFAPTPGPPSSNYFSPYYCVPAGAPESDRPAGEN